LVDNRETTSKWSIVSKKSIQILLIEDNPGDTRLIQEWLAEDSSFKFKLKTADTLSNGLENLKNESIDLVLLDLDLPDCLGLNTFRRIHTSFPETPIVVLTGDGYESTAIKAISEGAQDYLIKGGLSGWILYRSIIFALERRKYERHLVQEASQDALTNLPNRALYLDRLNKAIHRAKRSGKKLAIFFLDLDGLKTINDSYGHQVGDLLLQSVTSRLKNCVRNSDMVSRYGGDEFTMFFEGLSSIRSIDRRAQKILDAINQSHNLDGIEVQITASIGICLYPDSGGEAQTLLKEADALMCLAKNKAGNNYRFYAPADGNQ
jgi:diguanylate cyclase (GGDEF)-like protein